MSKKKTADVNFNSDYGKIDISMFKKLIKGRWHARNSSKLKVLRVVGHRGIGKSQAVQAACDELSVELNRPVECKVVTLSVMEAPDFNGLPVINDNLTTYAKPSFIPSEGEGVLFLDEFSRAPHDIQQALLTFCENRQVNGHHLGEGWIIVAADNPDGSESGQVRYQVNELDPALADRITNFMLEPSVADVMGYLTNKYGENHSVIRWLNKDRSMVAMDGVGKTSPRSLEYLIRAINTYPEDDPFIVASGEIGLKAALDFKEFLESPDNITMEELLALSPKVRRAIAEAQSVENPSYALMNSWNSMILSHVERIKTDPDKRNESRGISFDESPEFAKFMGEYLLQIHLVEWWATMLSTVSFWNEIWGHQYENCSEEFDFVDKVVPGFRAKLKEIAEKVTQYQSVTKVDNVVKKTKKRSNEAAL